MRPSFVREFTAAISVSVSIAYNEGPGDDEGPGDYEGLRDYDGLRDDGREGQVEGG